MDQLSRTFAALADPTRRDLVSRLAAGDATLAELAAPYAMSLQAVAKHLSVLERAGMVTKGRDAQRRPVHLEADTLAPVTDWLEVHRRRVEDRFGRLDALLAEMAADEAYPETVAQAAATREGTGEVASQPISEATTTEGKNQ